MNFADKLESIAQELQQYAEDLREGYLIDIIDLERTQRRLHDVIAGKE